MFMADADAAAVDLILARRAWAMVVRDNDRDDNSEGGDPPVPNDAAASGLGSTAAASASAMTIHGDPPPHRRRRRRRRCRRHRCSLRQCMRRWEVSISAVSIASAMSIMPPPSLARAEDGSARGDAILAVLVLEAVLVIALDVLEKFRALRRRHRAVVLFIGLDERRHDAVARGEGHLPRFLQISAAKI